MHTVPFDRVFLELLAIWGIIVGIIVDLGNYAGFFTNSRNSCFRFHIPNFDYEL